MEREQSFLQDILEHPEDDTPRMVYADWLADKGDPAGQARGEFIRLQCLRAKDNARQVTADMLRRERDLLTQYKQQWLGELEPLLGRAMFQRGFLHQVRIDARVLLASGEELLRRAPVQHLELFWGEVAASERAEDLGRILNSLDLKHLSALEVPECHLDSEAVEVIASCSRLTNLRLLNLSTNRIGDRGLRALASGPLLAQLTHLDLSNNDFSPKGARSLLAEIEALIGQGFSLRLRTLDLTGNERLTGASRRSLTSCAQLHGVLRLG